MSFNWPTTGFTGTEVEAFETAYKELAEEILIAHESSIDNIGVEQNHLKLPYRDVHNLKLFLEKGLLYASFIVKQRAGNSGPGTDFDLTSSPVKPPGFAIEDVGCIFTNEAMKSCLEENMRNEMAIGSDGYGGDSTNLDINPFNGPLTVPFAGSDWENLFSGDDPDRANDQGDENDPCPEIKLKWDKANEQVQAELQGGPEKILGQMLGLIIGTIATGAFSWTPRTVGWGLQYLFCYHYLEGTGDTIDREWLENYAGAGGIHSYVDDWIREATARYIRTHFKLITPDQYTSGKAMYYHPSNTWMGEQVYMYSTFIASPDPGSHNRAVRWMCEGGAANFDFQTSCTAGGYNMNSSDYYLIVNGGLWSIFRNTFGTLHVVTDGTPIHLTQPENIKGIYDDYDFKYGWEIARDAGASALKGTYWSEDEIKSGVFFRCPNDPKCSNPAPNNGVDTTACEASRFAWDDINGWIRYMIAANHGDGAKDLGEWVQGNAKPFVIALEW